MSKLKTHPHWIRVGKDDDKRWEFRGELDCPTCQAGKCCIVCRQPFNCSTADEQDKYCSRYCEGDRGPGSGSVKYHKRPSTAQRSRTSFT